MAEAVTRRERIITGICIFAFVVALLSIARSALAQDLTPDFVSRPSDDGLILRASDEAYAELHYDNSSLNNSIPVDDEYTYEDLTVRVVIMVTGVAEKIWVYPSAGFVADIGYAEVLDGETITIPIRYAMF